MTAAVIIRITDARPASWADLPAIRDQLDRIVASPPAIEWRRDVGVTHTVDWVEYRGPEVDRLQAMYQTAFAYALSEHDARRPHWMGLMFEADPMRREPPSPVPASLRASRPIDRMIAETLAADRGGVL